MESSNRWGATPVEKAKEGSPARPNPPGPMEMAFALERDRLRRMDHVEPGEFLPLFKAKLDDLEQESPRWTKKNLEGRLGPEGLT